MLKTLFTSNARVKLLKQFFLHPNEEFFVRELTRVLDEQVNAVRRELDSLKKIGLLKSSNKRGKKYFFLNKSFIFYPELASMIMKNFVSDTDIKKDLSDLGEINFLYLSGAFVNKPAQVDLFIVGNVKPESVQKYLNEQLGEKDIRFAVISEKELNYRLDINDSFLLSIIRDRNAVILINKYKKKIEKLI